MTKSIGDNVRVLREQRGWSVLTLAKAAGMRPQYLARLEEETEEIVSFRTWQKLADALDVTLSELQDIDTIPPDHSIFDEIEERTRWFPLLVVKLIMLLGTLALLLCMVCIAGLLASYILAHSLPTPTL